MDEDVGVKVTRLRRRLSMEQSDDVKSPAAPSTPTKKRGGRLAAIPQLELINENAAAPESSPAKRGTRKSIARDIVEEEKPLTPGRRSTRIKSNTSIVSESTQSLDSPRAKRAARRNSQLGSDSEAPVTPARTRRTRKDSTSSIDKPGENAPVNIPIVEPINEEPENDKRKSTTNVELNNSSHNSSSSSLTVRKSPRIQAKKGDKSEVANDLNNSKSETNVIETSQKLSTSSQDVTDFAKDFAESKPKDHEIASSQIDDNTDSKKNNPNVNKSISKHDTSTKSKRNRTKSWTTLTSPSNDSSFLSDNEGKKKKVKNLYKSIDIKNLIDKSGSGDSQLVDDQTDISKNSINTSKTKRLSESNHDKSVKESSVLSNSNSDKENLPESPLKGNPISTALLFDEEPSAQLQTMVYIEDSNSKSSTDAVPTKLNSTEDQCVPVVNQLATQEVHNNSCEPMDIDETIPENTSLLIDGDSVTPNKSDNKSRRKSSVSVDQKSLNNESFNKSLAQEQDNTLNKSVSVFNQSQTLILNKSKINSTHNPNDDEKMTPSKSSTNDVNESLNNSKRKSSVSFSQDKDIISDRSEPAHEVSMNKTSKRKSSLSQTQDTSIRQSPSLRKSSINNLEEYKTSLNHSKSETKELDEIDNTDSSKQKITFSVSLSLQSNEINADEVNTSVSKSKRKSSISQANNEKESITENQLEPQLANESLNKSKRKSSLINDPNKSLNSNASKTVNASLDKSKKNISIQKEMKRKSSLSHLEKTESENKSTLILSQLKDTSNEENNELMSKSLNITDVKDNLVINKNLSINTCLTSTPLQQKNVPKLKSASKSLNESEINCSKQNFKRDVSLMSVDENTESENESGSDESDESESDENTSNKRSKLLDDEAEEAADDYESGDSQDEEEKRYAEENEIVEKGETLTSDGEFSDDTDYEKDSFIVSSDEEDNELLSGSGEDLSMSDNELNMSAKSKKKYNERKHKEQKQASREMFESRHKLNTSSKSDSDTKKNKTSNRRRLDSTLLKSEDDDVEVKAKKSNRLRINSSQESNASQSDQDESVGKKKTKRLSESVCQENNFNEKEITICNDNSEATSDPLSGYIKQEPKTPAKDFNISTIHFTDREEIEQVAVSGNVSVTKANEATDDPLQATMANEDSSSEISENQEITENYEIMLNKLNNATKLKTHDMSLNSNKKSKRTEKEPIIDELNLTQTRKAKNNSKVAKADHIKKSKASSNIDLANTDDGSSDSIDIKLLFPEDSNDSETANVEDFIPLRISVGKTNLREGLEQSKSFNQSSLNDSLNKKKKKNSINIEEPIDEAAMGTNDDQDTSLSKKKKKKNSISFVNESDIVTEDAVSMFIVDTVGNNVDLNTSLKKKKKKTLSMQTEAPKEQKSTQFMVDTVGTNVDLNTSLSKNRKNNSFSKQMEAPKEQTDTPFIVDTVGTNLSLNTSLSKKKKKNNLFSKETEAPKDYAVEPEGTNNNDTSLSKKKQKKNSISAIENTVTPNDADDDGPLEVSFKSEKSLKKARKLSASALDSLPKESENVETNSKKRKRSVSNTEDAGTSQDLSSTEIRNKKQKKTEDVPDQIEEPVKRNKKRKEREDDDYSTVSKVLKEKSLDDVHVPRLPTAILKKLSDKPDKDLLAKKKCVVATTDFIVEEATKRRNNPSSYLEESIYLNADTPPKKKQKGQLKLPKVLPFIPTAATSGCGSTTKFEIKIIPQPTAFVAQPIEMANFKKDYLRAKIKKHGTYELYKKNRNVKLSKF